MLDDDCESIVAVFKDIRSIIVQELSLAKCSIRIAVCWFTNREIFNVISRKFDQGVDVSIIILDDLVNKHPYSCPFQEFIEKKGKLRLASVSHPMHNKYCIIDNMTLIKGSYNWTYFAESTNEENILVCKNDLELVRRFIEDFQRLEKIYPIANSFTLMDNIQDSSLMVSGFAIKELVVQDLYGYAFNNLIKPAYDLAEKLISPSKEIYEKAVELNWKRRSFLSKSIYIELKDNPRSLLFSKGSGLPVTFDSFYTTATDNLPHVDIRLFACDGIAPMSSIVSYRIGEFPIAPVGTIQIKVMFYISGNGVLEADNFIIQTGRHFKKTWDLQPHAVVKTI